jgi:hypothetical protein
VTPIWAVAESDMQTLFVGYVVVESSSTGDGGDELAVGWRCGRPHRAQVRVVQDFSKVVKAECS